MDLCRRKKQILSLSRCVNADDTAFNYSGYLLGWIYATNELYEVDYDTFEEIYNRLSDNVKADLSANSKLLEAI